MRERVSASKPGCESAIDLVVDVLDAAVVAEVDMLLHHRRCAVRDGGVPGERSLGGEVAAPLVLYFLPLPQVQGSLRPMLAMVPRTKH